MDYVLATYQNTRCFQNINFSLKCENPLSPAQSRRYIQLCVLHKNSSSIEKPKKLRSPENKKFTSICRQHKQRFHQPLLYQIIHLNFKKKGCLSEIFSDRLVNLGLSIGG